MFSIFYKVCSCFDEGKCNIVFGGLVIEAFNPLRNGKVYYRCSFLHPTMICSILSDRYCSMCISDKSGAHMIPLCLKGKSNKMGDTFISTLLIFNCDIDHDVSPSISPIRW